MWSYIITTMYSLGIGFLAMEALNVWKVTRLQQINIWSNPMKRSAKIPRLSGQTLLIGVLFGGSVVVYAFAQYYKSATQWSCLGHFTKETSNLWLPVVLVNTCAALAASSFSYFSLFTMKNIPQYRQKMDRFLSEEDYVVKWSVEKCYRNAVFLFFLPWLLLASWITLAISSDWVTNNTLNILTVVISFAYSAVNIMQSLITSPSPSCLICHDDTAQRLVADARSGDDV
ncbi:unnamed protein product [Cylicocyclus nassatus]|uniref:Uncharacterized protein n=1 Tax=Cylicocyclus nassatus TaxID=53992 RepID=A0AA36GZ62_CYLNA|nr:unnamed protein product [Cylicocyclus nassatus]